MLAVWLAGCVAFRKHDRYRHCNYDGRESTRATPAAATLLHNNNPSSAATYILALRNR